MLWWIPLVSPGWAAPGSRGEDAGVYFGEEERLAGCGAMMEVDQGGDGTIEWLYSYTFDDRGLLVDVVGEALFGGVGHPHMAYAYDDDGRLTLRGWDGDNDGRFETLTVNQWRGEALVATEEINAASRARTDYVWEGGHLIELNRDDGADGVYETVTLQRWVGDILVRSEIYRQVDDSLDVIVWYRYDAFGRMVERETDLGADGFLDGLQTEVWGTDGRLAERLRDNDLDGVLDVRSVVYWSCPR